MAEISLHPDPKVQQILDFLLPHIQHLQNGPKTLTESRRPFVIGLSGLQGSGKSYLASSLVAALSTPPFDLHAADVSLDDFYVTRKTQEKFALDFPGNTLLVARGQPGTHDLQLVESFFAQFDKDPADGGVERWFWPSFDKSLFNGKGDRAPEPQWQSISTAESLDILVLEGWCIGFQPLGASDVKKRWDSAQATGKSLAQCRLEDVILMDQSLQDYCDIFMGQRHLDVLIQLQAFNMETVYEWREQQEAGLRARNNGAGMNKEEVRDFVRGYIPAYELYLDDLSRGFFDITPQKAPKEMHLIMDSDRALINVWRK